MKIRNLMILIVISLLLCFFYFYITPGYLHPAEDAAILFNYAQNLKETGVISYYPGGPKVDASTDFIFMLAISAMMYIVPDAYQAALMVSGLSSVLMMFFIFKLLDTKSLSLQYMALILVFFSQQIWAAVLGYGTFFFAMSICYVVLAYWKGSLRTLLIASTFASLCRPDAIITVLPLIAHKFFGLRGNIGHRFSQVFLFFVLPLLAYGVFRYFYFGRVLPLSFDINVDGQNKVWGIFHVHSFHHVKSYALYYIYPGILGVAIYFIKEKFKIKKEYYMLIISMIVLPMLAYMLIRENLDFSRRYFIVPYLGLVLTMSLLIRNYKSIVISIFGVFLMVVVVNKSIHQGAKSLNHYYSNIYDFSTELSQYPDLKLATSEAGIITWKSRLATMDLWGLNTSSLTDKVVTKEDIRAWNPDLIYLHAERESDYVYISEDELKTEKSWPNMTYHVLHTMQDDGYLTYRIPSDNRLYTEDKLDNIGLLKSLLKFISENNPKVSQRKDLIAIHPRSEKRQELIQLIEKYGGERFVIR